MRRFALNIAQKHLEAELRPDTLRQLRALPQTAWMKGREGSGRARKGEGRKGGKEERARKEL